MFDPLPRQQRCLIIRERWILNVLGRTCTPSEDDNMLKRDMLSCPDQARLGSIVSASYMGVRCASSYHDIVQKKRKRTGWGSLP